MTFHIFLSAFSELILQGHGRRFIVLHHKRVVARVNLYEDVESSSWHAGVPGGSLQEALRKM